MHTPEIATIDNETVPHYGTKPHKPGLYLGLLQGRHRPSQQMDDWGFGGPTIGPLKWCHTTYAAHIKLEFEESSDAVEYFGVEEAHCHMNLEGDMLTFGGMYYGDWTVYYGGPEDCERPSDSFRKTTRSNAMYAHRKFLL
ncbi:MAG: hypothetical protein EOP81_08405 [Variovorax sp.]|nr:MAG: hypothetical protein EOP81_08405 [Variovorax sp.]